MGRAFTLIELIVVVLIVTILAGLIAPRVLDSARRQAEAEAESVARVISAAAQKDALSPRTVGVSYDGESHRLEVVVLEYVDDRAVWRADPLVEPAELGACELAAATADGAPLDGRGWLLAFPPSQARATLSLLVYSSGAERGWQIDLEPEATAARLAPAGGQRAITPVASRAIDLDDAGRGDEPW